MKQIIAAILMMAAIPLMFLGAAFFVAFIVTLLVTAKIIQTAASMEPRYGR